MGFGSKEKIRIFISERKKEHMSDKRTLEEKIKAEIECVLMFHMDGKALDDATDELYNAIEYKLKQHKEV